MILTRYFEQPEQMYELKRAGSSGCCEKLLMGYLVAPLFFNPFKCWIQRRNHLQFKKKNVELELKLIRAKGLNLSYG